MKSILQKGWMYADTTTPDGYQVNRDGAWVVNGVVQTRNVAAETESRTEAGKRILVAYYTLPETDGTDTDAGASRVAVNGQVQGNMEYMANTITKAAGSQCAESRVYRQQRKCGRRCR